MRGITASFATILSLLMVSAPVSASVCDLSCWLRQTHSDCHAAGPASHDKDDAMSMPDGMAPGMDMGPGMSMSMSTVDRQSAPATGQPEPKNLTSCAHEACGQISVSASPPNRDCAASNSLHRVAISASISVHFLTGFLLTGPGTPPPKIPAVDRIATTLRI